MLDLYEAHNESISPENKNSTVADLPDVISDHPALQSIHDTSIPEAYKPPVEDEDLDHRRIDRKNFWKEIPAYAKVEEDEFREFSFQNRNTIRKPEQLSEILRDVASPDFIQDVEDGLAAAPMNLRISPYLLSLIDWDNPKDDPIRTQFIPLKSKLQADHPMLTLDSLHEQKDSPVTGLVHRYPDKALFLPLDMCPVYCRFCTRSYAIGNDTESVEKVNYRISNERWKQAFAYIASRPEIEDIVVSGGDTYMLSPDKLRQIGEILLAIPHIRRIRFASKGPAVMPLKILTDTKWTDTLVELAEKGRALCKEVCLHTHFNSTAEISQFSIEAMSILFQRGVKVRNQTVMLNGVNNDPEEMRTLIRKLAFMNVQPYYVYQHDMVKGVEDLRTPVHETAEIERLVRGTTAGFNTPLFVNDVPGGGGKRDLHSYDYYDPQTGISVYRSPGVAPDKVFLYFDPLSSLSKEGQSLWNDPKNHQAMVEEAIKASGNSHLTWAR